MMRSLAVLAAAGLALAAAACQEPAPDAAETQAAPVADPVISDRDLTIPPEEASAPPAVGMEAAPGAPGATPPVLPPEDGAAPSPADSPPQPDA